MTIRRLAHQTLGAQRYAVDERIGWEFQPGDAVIADGLLGVVAAVDDTNPWGITSYEVRLDNNMGGGEYTSSQLSRPDGVTASLTSVERPQETLEPVEAGSTALANHWYPELGTILTDRLPVEQIVRTAALRRTAAAGSPDHQQGLEHGLMGSSGNLPHIQRRVDRGHELDDMDQDYLNGHAEGTAERARRVQQRAETGGVECKQCAGTGMGPWRNGTRCSECGGSGSISAEQASKVDVLHHLTDDPHFTPNPHFVPEDNAVAIYQRSRPGLFAAHPQHLDSWVHEHGYDRPYVAEIHVPHGAHEPGRWGGERFIPGENLDQAVVHRVVPYGQHHTGAAVPPDEANEDGSMGLGNAFDSSAQPDVCSFCGNPGPWTDEQDTGRGTRIRCGSCGGTMRLNSDEVAGTLGIQWQPEFPNSPQNNPSRRSDPRARSHGIVSSLNVLATQQAGYAIFHAPELAAQLGEQLQATAASLGGVADEDFVFQFTATWRDVQEKAKRIRSEGGVRILAASGVGVTGEVRGDTATYESTLNYVPGTKKVANWECGCKWSAYAWGRSPAYRRFEGRQCSHALALQYEANARGMFGREVAPDRDRMDGQFAHSPVQVQYQRPDERYPEGRDITRRTAPPGNMRSEWHPKSRVRVKGSVASMSPVPPTHDWARLLTAIGTSPSDVLHAMQALGVPHAAARTAIDWATKSVESALVEVDGELHQVFDVQGGRLLTATGALVDPARARLVLAKDATADDDGGQDDPDLSNPRIEDRDKSDLKRKPHHLLHHTNDAREHAPNFGYGLPWGGTYAWCDQCNGSGCGHCGGTGQVAVGQGLLSNFSDASSTESPVPDQSVDAGNMISDAGGGMSATGAYSTLHVAEGPVFNDPEREATRLEAERRMSEHYRAARGFRDRGLCDCAGSMKIEAHTPDQHSDWADKNHAAGKTDAWGHPIMQPYDGHGAWNCNNYSCAEHPKELYQDGPGMPGWMQHEFDPHKELTREVGKAFYDAGHTEDGRFLLDQQHQGPSHLSSLSLVAAQGDDVRNTTVSAIDRRYGGEVGTMLREPLCADHRTTLQAQLDQHNASEHPHRYRTSVAFSPRNVGCTACLIGEMRSLGSVHTADYSVNDFGSGNPAQSNQPITPHSFSQNPVSTGWATSADPSGWSKPVINDSFGWWDAALHTAVQSVRVDAGLIMTAAADAEPPKFAGVALKANDTGRVLMIQRSNKDESDPARGTWEFPGGGREEGDTTSLHNGIREWEEEVGQKFPEGGYLTHVHRSGPYVLHVVNIPEEGQVDFTGGRATVNPDDPDGDDHEQSAWWDPEHARKNPALRQECKTSPWSTITKAARFLTIDEARAAGGGNEAEARRYLDAHHQWQESFFSPEQRVPSPWGATAARTDFPEHMQVHWDFGHQQAMQGDHAMFDANVEHSMFHGEPMRPITHAYMDGHEHGQHERAEFGNHDDMNWLLSQQNEGPSHLSSYHGSVTMPESVRGSADEATYKLAGGYNPTMWSARGDELLFATAGVDATLHDEPEGALPSTDGAVDDDDATVDGADEAGSGDVDVSAPTPGLDTGRGVPWGYPESAADHPNAQVAQPGDLAGMMSSDSDLGAATNDPEASMTMMSGLVQVPEGVTEEMAIYAAQNPAFAGFMRSAGFQALMTDAKAPQGGGVAAGDAPNDSDIAAAARAAFQKSAMKDFSFAEQQELIAEGGGKVRARNFNNLNVQGTHYERLGEGDPGDDEWFML